MSDGKPVKIPICRYEFPPYSQKGKQTNKQTNKTTQSKKPWMTFDL